MNWIVIYCIVLYVHWTPQASLFMVKCVYVCVSSSFRIARHNPPEYVVATPSDHSGQTVLPDQMIVWPALHQIFVSFLNRQQSRHDKKSVKMNHTWKKVVKNHMHHWQMKKKTVRNMVFQTPNSTNINTNKRKTQKGIFFLLSSPKPPQTCVICQILDAFLNLRNM